MLRFDDHQIRNAGYCASEWQSVPPWVASGVLADKPAAPKDDLPWQDARMLADVLER